MSEFMDRVNGHLKELRKVPHEITESRRAYDGKPLGDGLVRLKCSCGWGISHSTTYAKTVAERHLSFCAK